MYVFLYIISLCDILSLLYTQIYFTTAIIAVLFAKYNILLVIEDIRITHTVLTDPCSFGTVTVDLILSDVSTYPFL